LSQGSIRIENGDNAWLNENKEKEFHFVIHDKMGLVRDYNDRLKVEAVSREGTTLK
jgi:spore coat polysaccharide biosynthesis predicted glycosyltransferase SpsG